MGHTSLFRLQLAKPLDLTRTAIRGGSPSTIAKFVALVVLVFCFHVAKAQSNEWAWMGGSTTEGSSGVYGTQGTAAPQNVRGSRSDAVTWTDQKGDLWLFGGVGFDSAGNNGDLNDLWEFSPSTNEWTWVGGTSTLPGSGTVAGGTYGILGTPAPSNLPSGRAGGVGWTDANGNLWMFGGSSVNDLWEFNPTTKEWTWMGGSQVPSQAGVYGTLGTAAATNVPGSRSGAVGITDAKGNFWMFGGVGLDATGLLGNLNDLWKFSPSTNQWTWIGGANAVDQLSVPGTLKQPAVGNVPAGRNGAVGWIDGGGTLWIFGGSGLSSAAAPVASQLNDLWEFNPTSEGVGMDGRLDLESNDCAKPTRRLRRPADTKCDEHSGKPTICLRLDRYPRTSLDVWGIGV